MSYELEKEFQKFISGLLEKGIINKKEADYLMAFTELYVNFQEKSGKTKKEIYCEIGNEIGKKLLENIIEKKGGKFLDQNLLELLKEVPGIKLSDIKGLTPSRLTWEKLFQLAVFGLTDDKFITTGYLKNKPDDPYIPTNLCFALLNLGNLVDDDDLRSIVLNKVLELYGLKRGSYSLPTKINAGIRDEFYQHLKYLLYRIKWKFKENVEDLQDSLVFYNRSLALYSPEAGSMNIFSTSSGIVIPEEYRGDRIKKKNPYRKKYFDVGIGSPNAYQLPKYYQWDSEVTAKNLWKRYLEAKKSQEYRDEAVDVLAKFLQVPNLEITEAPFKEEPWKVFFTLVSDKTLVLSERGELRKINHGFMVDEDILKENREVYEEIGALLGKKENGIIGNIKSVYKRGDFRIYKRVDEVCSAPKEAKERARDIVEILLERGKHLEKKEERLKAWVAMKTPKTKAEEKEAYARVWTLETVDSRSGNIISKKKYEDIWKENDIPLLIIKENRITQIYIKKKKKSLGPRKLEVLEYFLKNRGHGGDLINLLEIIWERKEDAEFIRREQIKRKQGGKVDSDMIREKTSVVTGTITKLNSFLLKNLGVKIVSDRKGQYMFDNFFKYYLVKVIKTKTP